MTDDYAKNVGTDLEALARDGDCLVSAATGGIANQTVSTRVALADQRGERWACIFCAFLSAWVQRNHCPETLTDRLSPWWVYPRAAYCFLYFLVGLPWAVCAWSWRIAAVWTAGMAIDWLVGRFIR